MSSDIWPNGPPLEQPLVAVPAKAPALSELTAVELTLGQPMVAVTEESRRRAAETPLPGEDVIDDSAEGTASPQSTPPAAAPQPQPVPPPLPRWLHPRLACCLNALYLESLPESVVGTGDHARGVTSGVGIAYRSIRRALADLEDQPHGQP